MCIRDSGTTIVYSGIITRTRTEKDDDDDDGDDARPTAVVTVPEFYFTVKRADALTAQLITPKRSIRKNGSE